jgi:hypothetical protein
METASWKNCRAEFVFDGGLIDLLVPGTGAREWESFWTALLSGPFEIQGCRDSLPWPLPQTLAEVSAECQVACIMVSVCSGAVTVNCHFFGPGDLELDIDPRQVVDEAAYQSVLAVMRFVASSVGLPVFATPEGGSAEYAFLRVSPDGETAYHPTSSGG